MTVLVPRRRGQHIQQATHGPLAGSDLVETWERLDTATLLEHLGTSPSGLSRAEAAARLDRFGPNVLTTRRRRSVVRDFFHLFANPLLVMLLVASAISAALGQTVDAVLIIAMVLISAGINFRQAYQSQRAVEALQAMVALTARVLRDGQEQVINRQDVVPGDIILLRAGDIVPADGRLLTTHELFINEAALTGESLPAEKDAQSAASNAYLGTLVMSGSGTLLAVVTGPATAFGRIAATIAARAPETEFERGIRRFSFFIMRVVVALVLFVLFVNLAMHRDAIESFLFAIALAIGLTPELLPMVMSVTLAAGAVRMARQRVIVKHLPSIQNFGSMDVLCSDKTGTLTEGTFSLAQSLDPLGHEHDRPRHLAALNSAFESGIASPMATAILAVERPSPGKWIKIDEIPFDFTRRRSSVIVADAASGERLLVMKGAPESVLAVSTAYEVSGEIQPLTPEMRSAISAVFQKVSAEGYRTLGIAWKPVGAAPAYSRSDESGMIFTGFVTFRDPPRPEAGTAVQALAADGVRVMILTGDNELVATSVCRDIGLPPGNVVLGQEIDALDEIGLGALAEQTLIFARVTPAQKNRIIRALQRRGHVVGFLGDGINDAPSLHTADVGISVANATDVARESADIILLEHDLQVLHQGVLEGRRSFGNVMKYILMWTSSAFGNMLSMAGAAVVLPFLPMLPIQVLLNNLLYELSQVTLPTDRVDAVWIRKPKHWDIGFIQRFMVTLGPVSSVFDFLTFAVLLHLFHASEALFHTGWFIESLVTQTLVIYVIRTAGNPLRSLPSRPLAISTVSAVVLGVLLTHGPLRGILGFVRLPWGVLAFVVTITAVYLGCVEVVKRRVYRQFLLRG